MSHSTGSLIPIDDLQRHLMQRSFAQKLAVLPFTHDLFLLETHIAGLAHYQLETVQDQLAAGSALLLQREPCNPHDDLAIEVLTHDRVKLGYVPKNRNPVLARLMDGGKLLVAQVSMIGTWDGWGTAVPDVRLRISLRE